MHKASHTKGRVCPAHLAYTALDARLRASKTTMTSLNRRNLLRRVFATTAVGALPVPTWAQVAQRSLRILVPYPAGGAVDFVARLIAGPLRAELRRDAVIENLSGAAGAIGLQRLLADLADGNELAIGTDSDLVLAPLMNKELRYTRGQFRCLGVINSAPMILVAGPRAKVTDLAMLLEGRAPIESIGSYGAGSNSDLLAREMARRARLDPVIAPHRGIAPLVQDLLGGQIEFAFLPLGGSVPDLLLAGKLRAVGAATRAGHPMLRSVARFADQPGFADFIHHSWAGAFVSGATSDSNVNQLHAAVQRAILDADLRRQLEASGGVAGPPMSLAEARTFVEAEGRRYEALVTATVNPVPPGAR